MAETTISTRQLKTVAVGQGGTGATTLTSHGVLIGNGTGAVATSGAGTAGQPFVSGGASADGAYSSSFIGKSIAIYKTAGESVISSTALQNDNEFSFAIAANETWKGSILIGIAADASGGFKCDFTIPSGASGTMRGQMGSTVSFDSVSVGTASGGTAVLLATTVYYITFSIVNSSNAGTVQFRFAQNASFAVNTTVKAGSLLMATRTA